MSKIQQMRDFIARCPHMDVFTEQHIDWTTAEPGNYGIMPTGESIINVVEDINGNKIKYKQANFSLYASFFTVNDVVRLESAGFLEDFTDWIEEQSENGTFPHFGDVPDEERITAQNGMLFRLSENGKTGLYQIQIQCFYTKVIERNDF